MFCLISKTGRESHSQTFSHTTSNVATRAIYPGMKLTPERCSAPHSNPWSRQVNPFLSHCLGFSPVLSWSTFRALLLIGICNIG